jgi:site-specific recombinase XerD
VDRLGRVRSTRLSDRDVARIVKRTATAAGLDPSRYAGHSLRAGLATSAAAAGVEERQIMAQIGHKSVAVARRYIRDGSLFRNNAAGSVGL